MPDQISCPACHGAIAVEVPPGTSVRCPLCREVITVPGAGWVPAAAPVAPMPYGVPRGFPPSTALATASLVCGVAGLMGGCVWGLGIPVGIVGLVLGIVALRRSSRDPTRYGGRGMAIGGVCTGALSLLLIPIMLAVLLPSLSRVRELSMRVVCAANLRSIGQSLYIYAQKEPNGSFPDDLNKVISAGYVISKNFVCPSAGPMMQSYHYVPGYGTNSDPDQIIMFEDPLIHQGAGGSVLFQDSHVEFVESPRFETLISNIKLPDGSSFEFE